MIKDTIFCCGERNNKPTINRMADIARMFDVELNEEFYMQDNIDGTYDTENLYKITLDGLYEYFDNEWQYCYALPSLLKGEYTVIKKKWKPKNDEFYYHIGISYEDVFGKIWIGDTTDYALYKLGMIYSTKEEARKHFTDDYKKLTGKDIQEDYEYINNRWTYKKNNEKEV